MSQESIILCHQPETYVYAGDTGYIVIKQKNWPDEDMVIVIDPAHAEAVAKAIMAAAPDAIQYRKEWKEEEDGKTS